MIEITNKMRTPVPIIVRSRTAPRAFTTLTIPGVGKGKNVVLIDDERYTDEIGKLERDTGFIKTRRVPNKLSKGE